VLMIDYDKFSCKIFFFCINILSQVAMLDGTMVMQLVLAKMV
jgi:hypothetical protein